MLKPKIMKRILPFATALLLFFACSSKEPVQYDFSTADMTYEKISISGMSCTGCEETITAGVATMEGVQEARADYVQGAAWVSYDASSVDHDQLTHVIESRGYKVVGFESYVSDSTGMELN